MMSSQILDEAGSISLIFDGLKEESTIIHEPYPDTNQKQNHV